MTVMVDLTGEVVLLRDWTGDHVGLVCSYTAHEVEVELADGSAAVAMSRAKFRNRLVRVLEGDALEEALSGAAA